MFVRNTIKPGSFSFKNCKQLINKMFPLFHTKLNPIISCILYIRLKKLFENFRPNSFMIKVNNENDN